MPRPPSTPERKLELARARYKRYYEKNKEKCSQIGRRVREANPERAKETSKKWRKANPHKVLEQARLRRTIKANSIPGWYEEELVKKIYQKRDELNERYGLNLVVDHIIPINPEDRSVCGLHCWANLQLLDYSLNGSKLDKYQADW